MNFLFSPCNHLWPTLVLFGLLWSNSVHISPIKSIQSTLVHFSFIQAIRSTLVQFGPFYSLWFYSVHIGLIRAILLTSVLFSRHWPYSVHFGPIWFYLIHYVHIGPNLSIHSYSVLSSPHLLVHSVLFRLFWSYFINPLRPFSFLFLRKHSVHFCALTYREKTCLGWKRLFQI